MRVADLTPSQKAELEALAAMSDEDIDTSDIPEIKEFSNPRRGMFSGSPNRKAKPKRELELPGESGNGRQAADALPAQEVNLIQKHNDAEFQNESVRWGIAHEFAKLAVRPAVAGSKKGKNRGNKGISSRKDVYAALGSVDFHPLFDKELGPIDQEEFSKWLLIELIKLSKSEPRLEFGWALKMIAIYLKTTCYLAGFGRDNLDCVIHPPIDNVLIKNLREEFSASSSVKEGLRSFKSIGGMSIEDYDDIIEVCKLVAQREGCTLFEVEQYFRPR